jgi:hypothetical protein
LGVWDVGVACHAIGVPVLYTCGVVAEQARKVPRRGFLAKP